MERERGFLMSGRRVLVLYGSLLLGFAVVLCRLFWLCSNTAYAARAEAQTHWFSDSMY